MAQERQDPDAEAGPQIESGTTQPDAESPRDTQKAPTIAAQQAEAPQLSIREKLTQIKAEIAGRKSTKPSKISEIVEYLLLHNTNTIPTTKIAEIMGEGRISPQNRLQIMGLQNRHFVKHNMSISKAGWGSMRIIQGNPSHKSSELPKTRQEKNNPAQEPGATADIQPPQEPHSDQRAPYSPPVMESQGIKDINLKARLAKLNIETVDQLWRVTLATREEVHAALIKTLDNPRIRLGGVTQENGSPISTPTYLLQKFLETRTVTEEELAKGFPDRKSFKVAIQNTRGSKNSIFNKHGLQIVPYGDKYTLESKNVSYATNFHDPRISNIYTSAKEIKANDALFADAPQFSQFILGALSDLTMGATLEEFSVVTGLTEEDILKAVTHINTSVIPQTRTDIKIHNRNGVLILGTEYSATQIETEETRAATIHWKTVVFEIRERIGNTQAIEIELIVEPEDTPPIETANAEDTEPDTGSIQEKLSVVLANPKIKGAQGTLLKSLAGTTGEVAIDQVTQIITESGLKPNLERFVFNTRRSLAKVGLTLEIDREKQVVRLKKIGKSKFDKKHTKPQDTSRQEATEEPENPAIPETEPTQKTSFTAKLEEAIASNNLHFPQRTRDTTIQILSAMAKEFDKYGKPISTEEIVHLTKLSSDGIQISNYTIGQTFRSTHTKTALEEIGIYIEVRKIRKPTMKTLYSFTTTPQENIETNPDEIKQIFEKAQQEGKIELDKDLLAIFEVLLATGNTALFVRDISKKLPKITIQAIGYNLNVLKKELEKIGLTIIIAAKNIKLASGPNLRYNTFRLAKLEGEKEPDAQILDTAETPADTTATPADTASAASLDATIQAGLSEKTKGTLSKLVENAYIAQALKRFIPALLNNDGAVKTKEIYTIISESGLQPNLGQFIHNSRRVLRRYGLTLTIDRPFVRLQETEPKPGRASRAKTKAERTEDTDDIIDISPQAIFRLAEGVEKEIEKRLEEVRTELATTQAQLAVTKTQLAEAQQQASKAIGHGLQAAQTIETLETQLTAAKTRASEAEVREINTSARAAGSEIRAKNAEGRAVGLELRAKAAEAEVATLRQAAPSSTLVARTKTLEATSTEKDTRITELETALQTARQTLTQVRATIERNTRHDTRIEVTAEFTAQIQKLEGRISDLEKEIRQLHAAQTRTLRLLQQQNLDSPQAVADISELTHEATRLRKRNIELQRRTEEAETRANAAEKKAQPADVIQLQAEIERLGAELAASQAETIAAKAQPTASPEDKATISLLEEQLATMQRIMTHNDKVYKAELAEKDGTIANLRKQQKAQTPTTNTQSSVNTETSKKLGELQRDLAKERDTTYNLRQELAATTTQLQDIQNALRSQNSKVVKIEKKGLVDQLREELVGLKAENLKLRRAGDSTEKANLLALVDSTKEKMALLEQRIADGLDREAKLRAKLSLAPKTPEEIAAEEARTKRALAEKIGSGIPKLKELNTLVTFVKNPRNTALPMGISRAILGEFNGLNSEENFTKTALTAFRDKLQELETAITENPAISRSTKAQELKKPIQSVISYLSSVILSKETKFTSEMRNSIINQVRNILPR